MATTEDQPLYAPREPIFPRRVSGKFRRLKWWIMIVTLGIYYLTPWIRWDRGPNLPDQAVLVDMAGRRFYFFWIEIWPHEFYFVAGLLIMAGLGLFLFTSALGRVWCGYACPQTVWTDLFLLVERRIEGDRNAQVRLWKAPWTGRKIRLRVTKWMIWLLISVATGGAWVFYFADAPTLAMDLLTFNGHPIAYTTIAILTATTFIFGGFMREQICIYMCPWPRIQAAMMDNDTLTVAYRDWRGEPRTKGKQRRKAKAAEAAEAASEAAGPGQARYASTPFPGMELKEAQAPAAETPGDCIDCMACVNVCPVGIDIRNGQQLECITCALCIDACDDIMAKIGKPRGLIDYLALSDEDRERAGQKPKRVWQHIFRLRTIVYTVMWSAIGIGLLWALFIRSDMNLTVEPVRNPQFITLADGSIRNAYTIRLRNMTGDAREFRVLLNSDDILRIDVENDAGRPGHVTVAPDETLTTRVYVTARPQDPAATRDRTDLSLWIEDVVTEDRAGRETVFIGNPQ